MLESLIRLWEAQARLLMKSTASVFDAICVIILMEHTLMSCLFGGEMPPEILFNNEQEYLEARDQILIRLNIEPQNLNSDWDKGEIKKCTNMPSPIRKLEEKFNLAKVGNMDESSMSIFDQNSSFNSSFQGLGEDTGYMLNAKSSVKNLGLQSASRKRETENLQTQ